MIKKRHKTKAKPLTKLFRTINLPCAKRTSNFIKAQTKILLGNKLSELKS